MTGETTEAALAPGYWMHETSGVLRPAVEAYLMGAKLTPEQIAAMRSYLRQWIMQGTWVNADKLRQSVDAIASRVDIEGWLDRAMDVGIDPL